MEAYWSDSYKPVSVKAATTTHVTGTKYLKSLWGRICVCPGGPERPLLGFTTIVLWLTTSMSDPLLCWSWPSTPPQLPEQPTTVCFCCLLSTENKDPGMNCGWFCFCYHCDLRIVECLIPRVCQTTGFLCEDQPEQPQLSQSLMASSRAPLNIPLHAPISQSNTMAQRRFHACVPCFTAPA